MVVSVINQKEIEQSEEKVKQEFSQKNQNEVGISYKSTNVLRATFSVEEAAQYIGIGISKTYNLVKCGAIPCVRIGKSIRISRSLLERLVDTGFTA